MDIRISTNFPDVQRAINRLRDDIAGKASARAMNRTIEQGRTEMSKQIRREYLISAAMVRERLRIKRAVFKGGRFDLEAQLIGGDGRRRSMNLVHFLQRKVGVREAQRRSGAEGDRPQLRFKIKRGSSPVVVKGAFLGNNGRTVFIRTGDKRLPIRALSTIGVPSMFNNRQIRQAVVRLMRDKFPLIFEREKDFFVAKFGR